MLEKFGVLSRLNVTPCKFLHPLNLLSKFLFFRMWITVKAVYLFGILSTSPRVWDQRNDNGRYQGWPTSHMLQASESSEKVEMNFCRILALNRCDINQAFERRPFCMSWCTLETYAIKDLIGQNAHPRSYGVTGSSIVWSLKSWCFGSCSFPRLCFLITND